MSSLSDVNLTAPKRRSLYRRILVALLVVFMLGFGNIAVHLYGTRDELRRVVLSLQARAVSEGLRSDNDLSTLPRDYAGAELGYTLYSADGQLLWFSENLKRPRRLRTELLEREPGWWRWSPYGGRVVNVPVRLEDGAILMVSRNDAAERELLDDLLQDRLRQSLVIMLPLGLISVVLILLLLDWTLRPVRRAALLARGIGPDEPQRRIPLDDLPREVHPLAEAANSALDRLAAAYAAERRFVADAAHELRTPLTVLDLRLQDARQTGQPDWPALNMEMRQMRRLVGQLLELARQDGAAVERRDGPLQRANVSRVAREATAALLRLFEAQGRSIEVDIAEGLECRGNPDQLREALVNLLENALVHGAGEVRLTLRAQGDEVILDIADQGDGVPSELQEAMFQRFRKGRQGSEGTGLGLAIVRRIVENAGGRVGFVSGRANVLRIVLAREGAARPVCT
ncbi:sensor histidine kinase [Stutzerimonas nitrititolerans]|uniref:sensor histidine kinase n=1 Tax=Stutzerimonas nitrititolerans TaxID=2482751 RepID=UPI0028A634F5|nr:HAMP domain-containing sensor histidine kinase [Stutzerimonas nitrititolerans]